MTIYENHPKPVFADKLHAYLYPEQHPPGSPLHNRDHPYWEEGSDAWTDDNEPKPTGTPWEWPGADVCEAVAEMVERERKRDERERENETSAIVFEAEASESAHDRFNDLRDYLVRVETHEGATHLGTVGDVDVDDDGWTIITLHEWAEDEGEGDKSRPIGPFRIYGGIRRVVVL